MWPSFFIAVLACAILVYVSGWLILNLLGVDPADSVCAAPLASCCLYGSLGIIFEPLGVHADVVTMFGIPVVIVACALLMSGGKRALRRCVPSLSDVKELAPYVLCGLTIGLLLLVKSFDGPESFFLGWDAILHLNMVQAFAESGRMSMLSTSLYETASDMAHTPWLITGSFYPASWHIISALVAQHFGRAAALAENACNYVFSSLVYPLSAAALLHKVFPGGSKERRIAPLLVLGIAAFPWMPLAYGPLYPCAAAFSLVPAFLMLLITAFEQWSDSSRRLWLVMSNVVCLVGLATIHPSAVFATGFFFGFYLWGQIRSSDKSFNVCGRSLSPRIVAALFLALCFALWMLVGKLPPFRAVTSYLNPPFASPLHTLANVFTLAYTNGRLEASVGQPFMALLVAIGFWRCARDKRTTWISALFAALSVMLAINMSTETMLKHLLTGLWYCDHNRVGALCGIAALPLAVCGAADLVTAVCDFVTREWGRGLSSVPAAIAIVCLVYSPWLPISQVGWGASAFGALTEQFKLNYWSEYSALLADEREFIEETLTVVPDGSMVANFPFDGSNCLYGTYDLHVLYRNMTGYLTPEESAESVLIREHLNEISDNDEVKRAVEKLGVEYVLILEYHDISEIYAGTEWMVEDENWKGLRSIDENTPGFELVMSEGPFSLYRVVG